MIAHFFTAPSASQEQHILQRKKERITSISIAFDICIVNKTNKKRCHQKKVAQILRKATICITFVGNEIHPNLLLLIVQSRHRLRNR